jgi:NAD(P)-dependent dehydrogenase (short-subunit alcohol dehydrogenase family)
VCEDPAIDAPAPRNLFDLSGKVALVTGGSRGIGRAVVQGFAEAGADVVIASRKLEACERAAHEVEATTGRSALPVACHVAHWDQCDALVDATYDRFGRCDILVNNAGMSPLYDDVVSITEEYYDKVAGVNLKGPFRLCARVGTVMAAGDGGSIINVSTVGSLRPSRMELVYAAAKAGLNALTVGLDDALGPKVRVNAILPGAVLTDIAKAWTDDMREGAARATTLGRAGQAADFVGTALWLASDASAWVSGTLIRVDGGADRHT